MGFHLFPKFQNYFKIMSKSTNKIKQEAKLISKNIYCLLKNGAKHALFNIHAKIITV